MKRIAIIGGGAKAAALCAKATCINLRGPQLELTVFERDQLGASWRGDHGYTNGDQRLCTPAERDVGFPYQMGLLDDVGVKELFARFSWASFLIHQGDADYKDWVDRGRPKPLHRHYADYLRWVIETSDANRTLGEVTKLLRRGGKWAVRYTDTDGSHEEENFDGLVITGPGPAVRGFDRPDDPRITDGIAFWRDPEAFLARKREDDLEQPVVIAGSGGTAAAIAAWIVRRFPDQATLIVGNQAALFTRTESFFENALFSDEDAWSALEPSARVAASERLNRGVVWSSVSDILAASTNIRFRPGRVISASIVPPIEEEAPDELRLEVRSASGISEDPACLIIDAAGFNQWWFADLFLKPLKDRTDAVGTLSRNDQRAHIVATMARDLSIELGIAKLHVPMLSQTQGPGFLSLMVLGSLSERVLEPYVEA